MPRGRKSKLKASEKRRQARLETQGHALPQSTKAAAAEASTEASVAAASMPLFEALLAGAAEASAEALVAGAAEASTKAVVSVETKASAQAAVAAGKAAKATKGKAAEVAASIAPVVLKKREATKRRKAEDVGKKTSTPHPVHGTKDQPHAASAANFKKAQEEQPVATSSKSQIMKPSFVTIPLYLNPDELARKAVLLEQFLLCKFKTKKVILKKDMLEIIGAELEGHFDEILKKASVRIEMEFAVKVMEVDPVIHSFDLVSKIKLPNNGRLHPGQGLPKTGLLMNILGIIFLKGNCATEEDLWKFLGMMKVFPGRKHSIYGEPRKLITIDLVRLNYLEYRQIPKSDPPRFEFLWGPKAYAETSKKQVMEFMATIICQEPSLLLAQYKDLLKE
ncbi:melanoma-associated antigen B5-like [Suncus etruscus]|uniref:melanoma-associated antigen B5-like n=1 Tax=Suncus etruscus TaxID=109475 RepID=UPI00210F6173|nr:melanoma-associated antigen B5-like [Suncus etruscus]